MEIKRFLINGNLAILSSYIRDSKLILVITKGNSVRGNIEHARLVIDKYYTFLGESNTRKNRLKVEVFNAEFDKLCHEMALHYNRSAESTNMLENDDA